MALFSEQIVRNRAKQEMKRSSNIYKSQNQILNESVSSFNEFKSYDIFLSHSSKDSELILGMKGILEDLGYSVYVDWVDDPLMDRTRVDKNTAGKLKERMRASDSLFYVTTDNAIDSKWMPWECGYFDGFREKVAIVPVQKNPYSNNYTGQEYLGLYPYCVRQNNKIGNPKLWIHNNENEYIVYDDWVKKPNNEVTWRQAS